MFLRGHYRIYRGIGLLHLQPQVSIDDDDKTVTGIRTYNGLQLEVFKFPAVSTVLDIMEVCDITWTHPAPLKLLIRNPGLP